MYRIALKMLFGDTGKYISMIVGISFSTLIMTQQPSILVGLLSRTYSFIRDVSLPDIWVMDNGVQFVEENKPLRDIELNRVRGIDGVAWAVPLYKGLMRAKLPDGSTKTLDIAGIDDATLIGAPATIIQGSLSDFRRPDAIFVDQEAANTRLRVRVSETQTRPLAIGDVIELNDKRAQIAGYIKATRNFVMQPQAYTTYTRAVSYSASGRRHLTYILVKVKEGEDPNQICTRISQKTGLRAETAKEFSDTNLNYWMKSTGIPINFGISVLLGFIVGTAVVGQTFFNFVSENIKHYAVLKAMGLRNALLAKMVMLQACVVGVIGYGIGVGLASLFAIKFNDSVLAVRMPPILLLFSGLGVLFIILTAAIISVRRVIRVDPALVFRG
ncbi:MAG: FtsX-like permease family protein [Pseudomonadota bacterium]